MIEEEQAASREELQRWAARARADSISLLAEEERRLAEERRQALVERERAARRRSSTTRSRSSSGGSTSACGRGPTTSTAHSRASPGR